MTTYKKTEHMLYRMLPPSQKGVSYYYSKDGSTGTKFLDPNSETQNEFNIVVQTIATHYDVRKLSKKTFIARPRQFFISSILV